MRVNFAVTSNPDGTRPTGKFVMTAIQKPGCSGTATGKIACLVINGNRAVIDGWMDDPSGIFSQGQIMQGSVTVGDPQTYGPPVDRAGFGIASGSPECPPAIEGSGPAIRTGKIVISAALS